MHTIKCRLTLQIQMKIPSKSYCIPVPGVQVPFAEQFLGLPFTPLLAIAPRST